MSITIYCITHFAQFVIVLKIQTTGGKYVRNDNIYIMITPLSNILLERLQMIVLIEFVLLNLYLAINIRMKRINERKLCLTFACRCINHLYQLIQHLLKVKYKFLGDTN